MLPVLTLQWRNTMPGKVELMAVRRKGRGWQPIPPFDPIATVVDLGNGQWMLTKFAWNFYGRRVEAVGSLTSGRAACVSHGNSHARAIYAADDRPLTILRQPRADIGGTHAKPRLNDGLTN